MTTTSIESAENRVIRPDLLAVLEDGGYRITKPRLRVIDLLSRKERGFKADDICDELPDVGRATVYRTIKLLLDAEVICKLALPDGTPMYSTALVHHHHHTVCIKCYAIGEFRHTTIERLLRTLEREISGDIVEHRIEIFTLCGECEDE